MSAETRPGVMHAEVITATASGRTEYLLCITDPSIPSGEARVRWKLGRREPWRCSACGPQADVACMHTFAAGLLLAERLLGLRRSPEYDPQPEGNNP